MSEYHISFYSEKNPIIKKDLTVKDKFIKVSSSQQGHLDNSSTSYPNENLFTHWVGEASLLAIPNKSTGGQVFITYKKKNEKSIF